MGDMVLTATVAVDKCLYPFDVLYDYRIPASLADMVQAGQLVMVPFGKGNQKRIAMVYSVGEKECDPEKLKPVSGIAGDGVIMSRELLDLSVWLKENTFCTYFDAIRTILPPGLNFSVRAEYSLAEGDTAQLTDSERSLLDALRTAKTEKELSLLLESADNPEKKKNIDSLIAKGFVVRSDIMKRHVGDETERMVRLSADFETNDRLSKLTAKQKAVIVTLIDSESASVKELCYLCNITPAVIKNLVKYNLLEEFTYTVNRAEIVCDETVSSPDSITLTPEQDDAFGGIAALMSGDKPNCALLHGVTGSGKTSVFIKLIDLALQKGRTALMLVPEISLTPQMVSNFRRIFGSDVAIIHSNLSMGRRADEYRRISSGEARIVIGTRSAIFAPLDNIGIIVIDEEGEHTYKSDRSPRYHARNVAKQRCFRHNSLLLLASATPSLDSFYNAKKGRYNLFTLSERFNKADLPEVYLVDMKAEQENGNRSNFSEALLGEIGKNLANGEQTLLLLNRRGYHTYISCINCGSVMECPNCGIPLTYHKANETVLCHYCGYGEPMPDVCPKCKSSYISQSGTGTQRIEDEINEYFPKARILRMDADTTMSKNAFSDRFAEFGRGEYDIMVGTQMIAKGLDFENVTLVGVLMIDKALYSGDYLGYERTFSLITQVVGRSGRGSKTGRAYLQTFSPDHYVLQLAARQDYGEFYSQEIDVREALLFPPFCDICLVGFSSLSGQQCEAAAKRFLQLLKDRIKQEQNFPIRVLGPTKMGTGRLGGRFRCKLVIKCRFNRQFRTIMNELLLQAYKDAAFTNVSFFVDINGEIV